MNKRVLSICFSVFFCATGLATAQVSMTPQQSVGKNMMPVSPVRKERMDKAYQLQQSAATALDADKYAEAESDAAQAIATGFGGVISEDILAQALLVQGKTNEAFHLYQKMVVNEKSEYPRDLLPYALLLLQKGQSAQSLDAYNQALPHLGNAGLIHESRIVAAASRFSPTTPDPKALEAMIHVALGNTYLDEATWAGNPQFDKALQEYTVAITLEPNSPVANLAYGDGLWRVGRKKEAVAQFQRVADSFTGDAKASAEDWLARHPLSLVSQR